MKSSRGFTLVELMIYAGLTAMVMGLFGAILVTILKVQGEQTSSSKVSSELSFIMTTIKRHIHETETVAEVSSSSAHLIKDMLAVPTNEAFITYDAAQKLITIADTSIGSVEQISSDQTRIDSLVFEKLEDSENPASIAIRVTITASASTTDPGRQATRTLQATASPFVQSQ